MRLVVLLAALIGLSAATGMASDKSALDKAGVLGKWAMDCSQPPSASNYHLIYAVGSDGTATETQRTSSESVRKLRNVQFISAGWLLYSYVDADGELLSILTYSEGKRKKSWWSVGKDGKAFIMDGKFQPDGNAVPWFEKCQ